jgi:DnaK suppressor protein
MSSRPIDLERFRDALLARRAELESLSEGSEESRSTVMLDPQSVGRISRTDAIQMQQMALEAERRRQLERRRIEAALRRIEEGEYGLCASCGEPIAPARLELDPAVPNCIACAEKG